MGPACLVTRPPRSGEANTRPNDFIMTHRTLLLFLSMLFFADGLSGQGMHVILAGGLFLAPGGWPGGITPYWPHHASAGHCRRRHQGG
jgi:hypothetical protein